MGEKPRDFPEMDEDFRRSGTYHLLVASGSNVGFVLALWFGVGRWILFLPRRFVWLLSPLWAFLYAGVAGADPPVLRAALMASLGMAAYLLAREDRLEHAVAFSALALLLIRPRALFEVGFQMSYAATLGAVLALSPLEEAAARSFHRFSSVRTRPLLRWSGMALLRLFLLSAATQAALSPLLIHHFHRITWAGLGANMAAVPWAGVCLALGAGLFLGEAAGISWASALLAVAAEKATRGLWSMARFFSHVPGADWAVSWTLAQVVLWSVLVGAALIGLASRFRMWKWILGLWIFGIPLLVFLGRPAASGKFSVTWVNVGLGDAVVAISPLGRVTVVDAGSAEAARSRLIPFLRSRFVRRIDRLIVTHADPPHAEGVGLLLAQFPVSAFDCAAFSWEDPLFQETRQSLESQGIHPRFLKAGDFWEEDGVLWKVLHPSGTLKIEEADAQGLVLLLRHGSQAALLSADLPPSFQGAVASQVSQPLSVLQWPHHGRVFPDYDFLSKTNPQWIVVSGDKTRAFVPAFNLGAPVRVTGQQGTLGWVSHGRFSRTESFQWTDTRVYRTGLRG
jgi:competence protein ComEC